MLVLGVDSGATDALAVIDPAACVIVDVLNVPTLAITSSSAA